MSNETAAAIELEDDTEAPPVPLRTRTGSPRECRRECCMSRKGAAPGRLPLPSSFVLSPKDPTASGVSYFLVIDGQQRLTTLMLLLCAIRDRAAADDPLAVALWRDLPDPFPAGAGRAAAPGRSAPGRRRSLPRTDLWSEPRDVTQ